MDPLVDGFLYCGIVLSDVLYSKASSSRLKRTVGFEHINCRQQAMLGAFGSSLLGTSAVYVAAKQRQVEKSASIEHQ